MWSQELWIQSASSTQKLPFATIRSVASEPIKGREEYHIVVSVHACFSGCDTNIVSPLEFANWKF